jgi:hypothetical protein
VLARDGEAHPTGTAANVQDLDPEKAGKETLSKCTDGVEIDGDILTHDAERILPRCPDATVPPVNGDPRSRPDRPWASLRPGRSGMGSPFAR